MKKWVFKGLLLMLILALTATASAAVPSKEDYEWNGDPAIVYRRLFAEENAVVFDDMKQYIIDESGAHMEFNFIPDADFKTTFNLKVSSGERIDCVELTCLANDWATLYANGQLQPVEEIFEEFAPTLYEKLLNYPAMWDSEGHLYAIPSSQSFRRGTTNVIRQDWLDALDMDMPETMDDFLEYCEAVKVNDMNGNGDYDDEYAVCSNPLNMFLTFFTGGYNGNWVDEDNNIWNVNSHPNYADLLDFVKVLEDNGYVPKEWQTMDTAAWWDLFYADCSGSRGSWYSDHCNYIERLWETNPEAAYVPLVPFECVDGIQAAYPATKPYFARLAFPKTGDVNGIIEVAKFLEWLHSDYDNIITVSYGLKGTDWDWEDKENYIIKTFTDTYAVQSLDYYVLVQFWDMYPAWGFSEYSSTVQEEMYALRALCNALDDKYYAAPVDFFVSYDYTGTEVENLIGEGLTLFNEAVAQYIADEITRDEFLAAQQKYIEIEDSIYSEVRTPQYKAAAYID
ncbi:MAG: extracellular solute-binding protein [Clostridia bacterium]|nr:extracellular solute-binding protein [Clostridia bacterium]